MGGLELRELLKVSFFLLFILTIVSLKTSINLKKDPLKEEDYLLLGLSFVSVVCGIGVILLNKFEEEEDLEPVSITISIAPRPLTPSSLGSSLGSLAEGSLAESKVSEEPVLLIKNDLRSMLDFIAFKVKTELNYVKSQDKSRFQTEPLEPLKPEFSFKLDELSELDYIGQRSELDYIGQRSELDYISQDTSVIKSILDIFEASLKTLKTPDLKPPRDSKNSKPKGPFNPNPVSAKSLSPMTLNSVSSNKEGGEEPFILKSLFDRVLASLKPILKINYTINYLERVMDPQEKKFIKEDRYIPGQLQFLFLDPLEMKMHMKRYLNEQLLFKEDKDRAYHVILKTNFRRIFESLILFTGSSFTFLWTFRRFLSLNNITRATLTNRGLMVAALRSASFRDLLKGLSFLASSCYRILENKKIIEDKTNILLDQLITVRLIKKFDFAGSALLNHTEKTSAFIKQQVEEIQRKTKELEQRNLKQTPEVLQESLQLNKT